MSGSRHIARRGAAQALYQWLVTGQPPGEIEPSEDMLPVPKEGAEGDPTP